MIVIKVELWPHGYEEMKQSLGRACIINEGTGTKQTGNYKYILFTKGANPRVWKEGEIKGFPRLKLLAWDLLYRVLREVVKDRNPE